MASNDQSPLTAIPNKTQKLDDNNAELIPPEIIFDILTRLPAKSVCRFRAVSKPWNSLLSQPHFIRAHLNRNKQHPARNSLVLVGTNGELSSFRVTCPWRNSAHNLFDEMRTFVNQLDSYPFVALPRYYVTSCDGLITLHASGGQIFIINPTTKLVNKLPFAQFIHEFDDGVTNHGLGYDSVSDDYKVVILLADESDDDDYDSDDEFDDDDDEDVSKDGCVVNVYSVRNNTWKRAETHYHPDYIFNHANGVLLNGYFHWMVWRISNDTCSIARFDMVEEKFSEMPITYVGSLDPRLVVLDGCLSVFKSSSRETYICMMKEYGVIASWKEMTIVAVEDEAFLRPLCMLGNQMILETERSEKGNIKLGEI